jgi:hypothetical protein
VANVDLVKTAASGFARLRSGDISRLRLVGFGDADPERRLLVFNLVEDYRVVLGSAVVVLDLPLGEGFEFVCSSGRGQTVEIDVLSA